MKVCYAQGAFTYQILPLGIIERHLSCLVSLAILLSYEDESWLQSKKGITCLEEFIFANQKEPNPNLHQEREKDHENRNLVDRSLADGINQIRLSNPFMQPQPANEQLDFFSIRN